MAVNQTLTVTEVADSQNVANNTSQVRILWKSKQSGDSYNNYTRTAYYWISINGGAETKYSVRYNLSKGTTETIVDTTITVTHKDDGSGTVSVRTWMDTKISAGEVELGPEEITLETIPRASSIDSLICATKYFTGELTYKYTPKSSDYYNRCNISLNIDDTFIAVKSVLIGKKAASQQTGTVTLSDDELATIYNKLPATDKGTLRFTFRTYSDSDYSSQVGDAVYKEISLYIPENSTTKPSVTMTLSPVSSMDAPFDSLYIKGRTKVDANFTNGEGKYGATIESYTMTVGGKSYGSPYTSGYLSTTGDVTVTGIVKDSRGFTGEYTQAITVIPYSLPQILPASDENEIICARCDEDGNLTESGTYLKIKARRSYSKVMADDVQKNFCAIRYRYRTENTTTFSSWQTLLAKDDTSSNTIDSGPIANVVSSAETAYVVQVGVIDDMGESAAVQFPIPTDFVTIDIPAELKGMRIGLLRYARNSGEPGIDVGYPIYGGSIDSLKMGTRLTATDTAPIDLDNYKTPDCYYSPSAENSKYILNTPYTGGGFGLEVRELQSENYIRQTIYYGRSTWIRHWNTTEWSEWIRCLMTSEGESTSVDFVVETGTKNGWTYKVWKSGTYEMFGIFEITATEAGTASGNLYHSEQFKLPTPFTISTAVVAGTATSWFVPISGGLSNGAAGENPNETIGFRVYRPTSFDAGAEFSVRLHVTGKRA